MRQDSMKSLRKSLELLKLFLNNKNEISITEVSKISGLNKSTVARIASVLVEYNFLKQTEPRGKYSLGTIYLSFAGVIKSRLHLRTLALPYLLKLSQQVHETVIIVYGNGKQNVFTETFHDSAMSNNILRIGVDEGTQMPLYTNPLGKILLADMSEEELQEYLHERVLKGYTPNTITNINLLRNHLMKVRQEGIAFDEEEHEIGLSGIGAGIKDAEGKIQGAIAIVAPSARLTRARMQELIPEVKNCAMNISRELGFQG